MRTKRTTTLKPCGIKMIVKDEHLTKITVTPKISKKEIEKLRHDWKHPKQGTDLKPGTHTIVVKVNKKGSDNPKKPNRITNVGIVLPLVKPSDKVSKHFKSITVTITKNQWPKGSKTPKTVKKVIHVPTTVKSVGELRNILKTPHHYVKKVTVKLTVKKPVKVNLIVKGCVEKVPAPPRTTTAKSGVRTKSTERTTTLKPCGIKSIIKHERLTKITVTPKIPKTEITKLRHDWKHPKQGTDLKPGTHKIVVTINKGGENPKKPNRVTNVGITVPLVNPSDKVSKHFKSITVTITKNRWPKDRKTPKTVKKVIRVPTTVTSVGQLRNILKTPHHYVKKVTVKLTVKKPVKVNLILRGCVKEVPVPPRKTTTKYITPSTVRRTNRTRETVRSIRTTSKSSKAVTSGFPLTHRTFSGKDFFQPCVFENLIVFSNSTQFSFVPNITGCEEKKLRLGLSSPNVGVDLICGTHSVTVFLSYFDAKLSQNFISEIGFFLVNRPFTSLLTTYFEYLDIVIKRFSGTSDFQYINIPLSLTVKDLFNVLRSPVRNIKSVRFDFKLKENIVFKLLIRGCMKNVLSSTIEPSPSISEDRFKCLKVYNLLQKNIVQLSFAPMLPNSTIERLVSTPGSSLKRASLPKGIYNVNFDFGDGRVVNIVEMGLFLADFQKEQIVKNVFQQFTLTFSRVAKRFGKHVMTNRSLVIPENFPLKYFKNVLKNGFKDINRVHLKIQLKQTLNVALNLRGCTPFDSEPITPRFSTTPKVDEEKYKCDKLKHLWNDVMNVRMNAIPYLSDVDIDKLGNSGINLTKGEHLVEIKFNDKKTPKIIELGFRLRGENKLRYAISMIEIIRIKVTRVYKSFGKQKTSERSLKVSNQKMIGDLKNVLSTGLTQINKVFIKFRLKKDTKVTINLKGCYGSKKTTEFPKTTVNELVNEQMYKCEKKINILKFDKIVQISKVPSLPSTDNKKLRFVSQIPNQAAPIIKGKQMIDISLPSGDKAIVVELGLNFVKEKNYLLVERFIRDLSIVVYRIRKSFGRVISTPMNVRLARKLRVVDLKNVLKKQIKDVNRIKIQFKSLRQTFANIKMIGCFSKKVLHRTTLMPVDCLHLNKIHKHGELIPSKLSCDAKICSDGKILPVFVCNKKWTRWQKCSRSCGAGESSRRQVCLLNPKIRSINKQNLMKRINETCFNKLKVKPCFDQPCQDSCKLTQWSDWSACDTNSCKTEYQTRVRQVVSVGQSSPCTRSLMESRRCVKEQCPCEENAKLSSCANIICPTSCDHLNQLVRCVSANKTCVKGCVCKAGYLYQNGKCVPKSNCLCLKPDFGTLMLSRPFTKSFNQKSTKTFLSRTKKEKSGSKKDSQEFMNKPNVKPKPKISNGQLEKMSKKELQELIKNKEKTPPWNPGQTNAPLFQATPPWFPGITPAGATIKLPTDAPVKRSRVTPPHGLTAAPPDSINRKKKLRDFIVTKRFVPQDHHPKKINKSPNVNLNKPGSKPKSLGMKPSDQSRNPSIPRDSKPSSKFQRKPASGNKKPERILPGKRVEHPNSKTLAKKKDIHINANSTVIVDCQSCVCVDGRLACSGPHCSVGNNSWSQWTTWSPCTALCGTGVRRRFRQCQGYNCKDNYRSQPGITKIMVSKTIQAEDKQCLVSQCSCIFSRELIKIHIGVQQINKYNIDLAAVWIEKDSTKGLTNSNEIVEDGQIIKSGQTLFAKCTKCSCINGRFTCQVQCP